MVQQQARRGAMDGDVDTAAAAAAAAGGPDGSPKCDEERIQLEQERQTLRSMILETRKRRAKLRRELGNVTRYSSAVFQQQNRAEAERTDALSRYRSATSGRTEADAQLATIRKLDVTNDCFHIWHRGPFGTINGLRLGTDIINALSASAAVHVGGGHASGTAVGNGPGSSSSTTEGTFDLSSMVAGAAASLFLDQTGGAAAATLSFDSLKVPWSETNAALGQVALLLSVLQQRPNSGIVFKTHELIPLGSCSKIGVLQPDGRPPVEYNLFYSDESFSFFGKRNFNTALDGLFRCLKDAIDVAARRDRTLSLPHEVIVPGRGEITIGGLPLSYDATNGETWTRAMKYLLTDLKWLVAFAQKNIDR